MLFTSYSFLLLSLPLLLVGWKFTAHAGPEATAPARLSLLLLVFSAIFYAFWSVTFFVLLLGVTCMNYAFALLLEQKDSTAHSPQSTASPATENSTTGDSTTEKNTAGEHTAPEAGTEAVGTDGPPSAEQTPRRLSQRGVLTLALICNLLPLLWFKYSAFLADNAALLLQTSWSFTAPALPQGISFITFIQIAWLVGVYRRQTVPQGLTRHMLFSSCFPYIISGPIVCYEQLGPQFDTLAAPHAEGLARGFSLCSMGLAKKVLLADSLAVYADSVFNAAAKGFPLSGMEAWLGSFCYTFQLYFDFSGYTDMALGIGLMLGLRLPENFLSPYKATGIVDFWRRWHITLSSWLRDFLYIPLGGNRRGRLMQYRNLFVTMLIGGAWHGAGWTFMIWGALHGLMLGINHFFRAQIHGTVVERALCRAPLRALCILCTFICINLCWVVFRAQTPEAAWHMYSAMCTNPFVLAQGPVSAGLSGLTALWAGLLPHHLLQGWQVHALLLLSFILVWAFPNSHEMLHGRRDGTLPLLHWRPSRLWAAALALLTCAALVMASRKAGFLYFQF